MNKELIEKYLNGTCDETEKRLVESWYEEYNATTQAVFDEDSAAIDRSARRSFEHVKSKLGADWAAEAAPRSEAKVRTLKSTWRRYVAVAAMLLLGLGLYWVGNRALLRESHELVKNDVKAGGHKATLTLSDGRTLVLGEENEDVLLNEAGLGIQNTQEGKLVYHLLDSASSDVDQHAPTVAYNTVSTPRTGRYEVLLPDGSLVTLNAESSLRYRIPFEGRLREVYLDGEAYFEIKPMETRDANNRVARVPFVVYAGDQRIEVLGTNFNVNAYKDEQRTATTLVSGKVEVSWDEDPNRRVTLEPGQFASTDRGGLVSGRAHLESVIAWKNNHFYFNDQHISSIMRQLSRWYDVDFVLEDEMNIDELYFSGSVSNDKNLSQVLRIMERTGMVKFNIEGRRVIVKD